MEIQKDIEGKTLRIKTVDKRFYGGRCIESSNNFLVVDDVISESLIMLSWKEVLQLEVKHDS